MFSLGVLLIVLLVPTVAQDLLKFIVEEKSPLGTFVGQLSSELQVNSLVSYALFALSPLNKHLFAVDNRTGQLTTASTLDREQMCLKQQCSCLSCEVTLQLLVRTPSAIAFKLIEVRIQDLNDHSPKFDNESTRHVLHVKANVPLGHRIVLPSANDPDEGIDLVCPSRRNIFSSL